MISFISSFEIISVVIPDPSLFLWIAASAADAATVNPNDIITLLANGLSTFPIKGKPGFSNGPKSIPKIPPDWAILCKWVFDNFVLTEELLYEPLKPVY